jgi:hypothetical protein
VGNLCALLVGKPEEKRPLRRPVYCLEDNIKMDLVEVVVLDCGLCDS